jgi:hypothetical protein
VKTISLDDKNLQLIQDNVINALAPLETSPLIGGVFLSDISLASGSNAIVHRLKRVPQTVFAGCPNVNTVIWVTAKDSEKITVNTSAACKVTLWVK